MRILRRRAGRVALALIAIGVIGGIALAAAIVGYGAQDQARPADVIVVLGAGETGTERRAAHAAQLFQAGFAPYLLCSGGYRGPDGRPEAEVCADFAREAGVPANGIVLEPDSRNTEQNARHAAAIMRERGWRSAVVVSDGYHLLRARWLFERQDVAVWTSPATDPGDVGNVFDTLYALLREVGALSYQAVKIALGL